MYADNTLTPKEATRLCALGMLGAQPIAYAQLAGAVRHFMSHLLGPSLDVLGTSIELLKYEGLVTADGEGDDALLAITDQGRDELKTLLTANVRAAANEFNNLIIALKFRFLHLLDRETQLTQVGLLLDANEIKLARLSELRKHHGGEPGFLTDWLDYEIARTGDRITWLEGMEAKLS